MALKYDSIMKDDFLATDSRTINFEHFSKYSDLGMSGMISEAKQ